MATRKIIHKDLLILSRDRRTVMILIAMPLVFIAIIGFSTGQLLGWKEKNTTLRIAVVTGDDRPLIRSIVDQLGRQHGLDVVRVDHEREARQQVDDGDVTAFLRFGGDFERHASELGLGDLLSLEDERGAAVAVSRNVEIYHRPTDVVAPALAEQIVRGVTMRVLLSHVARSDPVVRAYLHAHRADTQPVTTQPIDTHSVTPDDPAMDRTTRMFQVIVPSYTVLFTFFLINIMARSFLSERDTGTLSRLRAAPIGTGALLVGKTIPFLLVSVIQGLLLFLFGKLLFGMSWGPTPWLLPLVIVCTSLSATGLGLMIAVWVRNDAQVSAYANLIVLTFGGLSGCFMPRAWLPETMRQISLATPHAWALIAYNQVLNTPYPDLPRVIGSSAMLLAFTAIFAVAAWRRFARFAAP